MNDGESSDANDTIIQAWNTVLFDKFKRFKHLLIDGLSGHSDALLSRGLHPKGSRVVDIGCGFGDTTLRLANDVGASGEAVGVDCAENFIREAREFAQQRGAQNVAFRVADVQTEGFGGPYDYAFGRFGTMFFNMPGAAMRNIRRHLRPGGRLDMIVWRKREDNPWLHEAELSVRALVPVISHEETDQVHCGPGPFSMSGPDLVSSMLTAAGYQRITFERFDTDICIGRDLEEGIAFAMALGPAGEIIRLAGKAGQDKLPEVRDALSAVLKRYQRDDGIWAPSSTWFVSATNPISVSQAS